MYVSVLRRHINILSKNREWTIHFMTVLLSCNATFMLCVVMLCVWCVGLFFSVFYAVFMLDVAMLSLHCMLLCCVYAVC